MGFLTNVNLRSSSQLYFTLKKQPCIFINAINFDEGILSNIFKHRINSLGDIPQN